LIRRAIPRLAASGFIIALSLAFAGCKQTASTNAAGKTTAKASPNASKPNEPNVTFPELQGGSLPLASLRGKVVLVNMWATWCEPCREEIPWLIAFQGKYANQGFTILGVAMDEEGAKVVAPWVQKTEFPVDGENGKKSTMDYPILIGNEDLAEKFGGLIGLPTSVLISRDGKIVKRYIGEVDKSELQQDIETQLQLHP
jgi:cytochrome c biogenesis protein CcmG, thiol:disulfide interchange protein DsbE